MDLRFVAEALTRVPLPGQLVVLGLMLGCAMWTALRPGRRLPVIALGLCMLFWLRANSYLEGAILVTVTRDHGLTVADLLVPALACVVLLSRTATARAAEAGDQDLVAVLADALDLVGPGAVPTGERAAADSAAPAASVRTGPVAAEPARSVEASSERELAEIETLVWSDHVWAEAGWWSDRPDTRELVLTGRS